MRLCDYIFFFFKESSVLISKLRKILKRSKTDHHDENGGDGAVETTTSIFCDPATTRRLFFLFVSRIHWWWPDVSHDGNGFLVRIWYVTATNVATTITTAVVVVTICRCYAVETIDNSHFLVAYNSAFANLKRKRFWINPNVNEIFK